jgi:hypothetical protein
MLNFKNFSKTDEVLKITANKKSIISKESLERILITSSSYAFVLAENTKDYISVILSAKINSRRCFPVVYSEEGIVKTCLLFTQNIHETEESFKNFLNETYAIANLAICYGNKSELKMLYENTITESYNNSITEFMESSLKRTLIFHGLDIPTTEDLILSYRKNNLIAFAPTEQEYNKAIAWKDII